VGRAPALASWVDPTVHAAVAARFRSKIVVGPGDEDCSIWIDSIDADGYGSNCGHGILRATNRYALALATPDLLGVRTCSRCMNAITRCVPR
jgi:hypothetical protein